jgi:hypothetical protein
VVTYTEQGLDSVTLRKGDHYRWRPVNQQVTEMRHLPTRGLVRVQPALTGGFAISVSTARGEFVGVQLVNAALTAGDAERLAGEIAERMLSFADTPHGGRGSSSLEK